MLSRCRVSNRKDQRDTSRFLNPLDKACRCVTSWLVVYELPNELFALLESGERSLLEISWKIKHDRWPPMEEEKKASEKRFIEESPTSLIDLPETRELFTHEELERLIPLAEQMWIDWRGRLPDDYVSPLK